MICTSLAYLCGDRAILDFYLVSLTPTSHFPHTIKILSNSDTIFSDFREPIAYIILSDMLHLRGVRSRYIWLETKLNFLNSFSGQLCRDSYREDEVRAYRWQTAQKTTMRKSWGIMMTFSQTFSMSLCSGERSVSWIRISGREWPTRAISSMDGSLNRSGEIF